VAGAAVGRAQVLAFRAARHGLHERRPQRRLRDAVAPFGIQDTPPGTAATSIAARVDLDGPPPTDGLLVLWSLRGAPHLIVPGDHALFSLGVLPAEGTRQSLWRQPEDALVAVEKAMHAALEKPMTKGELSTYVTGKVPPELAPFCRACDANHPSESIFRGAPLLGRLVLESTSPVVVARAATPATGDVDALRTELLLRYLHAYAPTTSGHFAEWAGITKTDAKQRWVAVADALVKVGKAFVLEEDLDELRRPSPVSGVRLVPNKDAYLQARDRDLLFPDPAVRKKVFPMLGGPGVVLVDGEPAATWRGTGKGKRYDIVVEPFTKLAKAATALLDDEAQRVARARGHDEASVTVR